MRFVFLKCLDFSAKSVSHAAVLEGKHHGSITVGKRKDAGAGSRITSEGFAFSKKFFFVACEQTLIRKLATASQLFV